MFHRSDRTLVFFGAALILFFLVLFLAPGVIVDFLSFPCQRAAEAMQVNWMWDPGHGCFIQQPSGAWIPIEAVRPYSP